jgi:phytoene dehydrogenase-like protein
VLDSYFECDLLKATLATDAVIGAMTSCHSPQSAYVLLHHVMTGSWFNVQGGMGTVTQALLAALRPQGGDNAVLTGATVRRLLLEDGPGGSCAAAARVVGVELEGGRVLRAPRIISTVAPTTTLSAQGWLPEAAEVLPSRLNRALAAVDASSGVVKINCAIDRLPQFRCRLPGDDPKLAGLLAPAPPLTFGEVPLSEHAKAAPLHLRGTVHFEANMGQIDAAYRDAAAGRPSQRPIIEMTLPSVLDPSLAPPGKHVCLLFVQYVPYEGWDAAGAREAFADRVFAVIDEFAPGFSASVLHRDVLTPPDLERIFSLPRGNIFQASMGLDQLFWSRPAPGGLGSYRSPIQGLYLGGAGTHPGGGVMGAPGHNATMQLLRDDGWSSAKLRQVSSCPTL